MFVCVWMCACLPYVVHTLNWVEEEADFYPRNSCNGTSIHTLGVPHPTRGVGGGVKVGCVRRYSLVKERKTRICV